MKKFYLFFIILSAAQFCFAQSCFTSRTQQYTFEKGISPAQENAAITACLLKNLHTQDADIFEKTTLSLRKSGNISAASAMMLQVLQTTKNPRMAFSAAAALISIPEQAAYHEDIYFALLTSPLQPDYKKTLAGIILASLESSGEDYIPYLLPALKAQDLVLQSYACAAYTLADPQAQDTCLQQIIRLYTFDKAFAQKAFAATGLKEKALAPALKSALKNPEESLRISAIEWISDIADPKLLEAVLDTTYNIKDILTLSAAANALAANYNITSAALKKALKKDPSTPQATVAVMAYTFIGSAAFDVIEQALKTGNNNEKANALRVISSLAGILAGDASYYPNPALEKQRIRKFIAPAAKAADEAKNPVLKTYADNAVKELYKLLNAPTTK